MLTAVVPPRVSMRPLRLLCWLLCLGLLLHQSLLFANAGIADAAAAVGDESQPVELANAIVASPEPANEVRQAAASAEETGLQTAAEARSDESTPAAESSASTASSAADSLLTLLQLDDELCVGDNSSIAACGRRPEPQLRNDSQAASAALLSATPHYGDEEKQQTQQQHAQPLPVHPSPFSSAFPSPPVSAAPKRNPIIELKENVMKQLEEMKEEKTRTRGGAAAADEQQQQDDAPSADVDTPAFASILAFSTPPATAAASSSSPASAAPSSAAAEISYESSDMIYPSSSAVSASDRFNYAAYDSGAKLLASSHRMQSASAVLVSDDDRYMMVPCSEASKWLVLQLKEDILLEELELHNLEHYSSSVRRFDLYGSASYPTDDWLLLGRFHAPLSHHPQLFSLPSREHHVRYLRLHWISQWKEEYYCTLTHLRVFGRSVLEAFKDDLDSSAEAVRRVELVLEQTEQQTASSSGGKREEAAAGSEQDALTDMEFLRSELSHSSVTAALASLRWRPTDGSSEPGFSSDSDFWQHFSAGSGHSGDDAAAGFAPNSAAVPVVVVTDSAAAAAASASTLRTQHDFVSSSACAPVPASSLVCWLNRTATPLDAASRQSLQSAVTTELRMNPVGVLLIPPPATAAAEEAESSAAPSESPAASAASSAAVRVEIIDQAPAEGAEVAEDAAAAAAAATPAPAPTPSPAPAAAAPAAAAAAAVSASSSSLLSGAVTASELIYSQMARLGAQAGRQSQAEAEAAASQIDPAYVERFARYSTRAADALSTAAAAVSHSSSTHSSHSAFTTHSGEADTAAAAEVEGSKSALIAEDGAAMAASGKQGKGGNGGSGHQSIFRTLTNRLKELEIHQALSTHFVSVLSGRFADDIAQLQRLIAAITAELERDREKERGRDGDWDRQQQQQEREQQLQSGRIAAIESGGNSSDAEETALVLQNASVTPGGAVAGAALLAVDMATLRATVADELRAELRAELQQEMRQAREAQAALQQQLAELRASVQPADRFQLPLPQPQGLLPAFLLLVASYTQLRWLLSLLSVIAGVLRAVVRRSHRLFPLAIFSSSRQAAAPLAAPAAAVPNKPSQLQRRASSSSAETVLAQSLVKRSTAQTRGREQQQQQPTRPSKEAVNTDAAALDASRRRPTPSPARSLPLCAHCLSSSPHGHAKSSAVSAAAAPVPPSPVPLASSSAVSGSSWPPPVVAVSASTAQLELEECKEEEEQHAGAVLTTLASAPSVSPSTVFSSSSAGHRSDNSFSVLQSL